MARRGKSINLFLMDGEPSERIKCTLANLTGVAYRIPRTALCLWLALGPYKCAYYYS
jgi:hypothetical protein